MAIDWTLAGVWRRKKKWFISLTATVRLKVRTRNYAQQIVTQRGVTFNRYLFDTLYCDEP